MACPENPLQPDPHLRPACRQPRQPAGTRRGEGRPIVAADRPRQPVLAEQPVHLRLHRRRDRGDDLQSQQITAEGVRHRQRIAARPIAGPEPALEIDAPRIVGRRHRRERAIYRQGPTPAAAPLAQPLAPQDVRNRARRRPGRRRIVLLQHRQQLLRTPVRLPLARLDEPHTSSAAVARPWRCGARERSSSPFAPSAP